MCRQKVIINSVEHFEIDSNMLKKNIILLTLFSLLNLILFSQNMNDREKIQLTELRSNIPIIGNSNDLILSLGIPPPYSMTFNRIFNTKTSYFIGNSIDYLEKGITYMGKDGFVKLISIDFEKAREVFISSDKIVFDRNCKLDEVLTVYNIPIEEYPMSQLGILSPYEKNDADTCFYSLLFPIGEMDGFLEFFFDCDKRLRYLRIDISEF